MNLTRIVSAGVVSVLLAAFAAAPCAAQGNVGAIGGTIMDSSGAVLPGATVTLSSAQGGTLGANQETVSDARGTYQFLQLVPGTYVVRGQMQGFRSVEQRDIVVSAAATARADLSLPLGQLEEGIVVSGEAPLLDTTSALRQTVLTQEVLQTLPNRMDVWSITRVIPSVVASKVDVGGSESFQQSGITVHGTSNENGYYIDGMNVSSTQGSGSIATFYLDPYAFAESNFQSGNAPAESATGGLVFNMISRTGTNRVRGGGSYAGTNRSLTYNNVTSALGAQILRNVPASVRTARPELKPAADLAFLYDWGTWLAGPVQSDKLWFSASWHHQENLQYVVGSYNPDGSSVPDDNFMWNFAGKLAWQINQPTQLSWFYVIQRKVQGHNTGGTMFVENGATTLASKTPQLHQVKYTRTFSSRLVVDASASSNRVYDKKEPPRDAAAGAIAGVDQVANSLLRVLPTYRNLPNARYYVQGNASYFTTAHDIKIGYQFDYGLNGSEDSSAAGMRAVYRSGVPDSVNTYNTPVTSMPENRQQSLYVQDKWRPARKLTLNLGLRVDTNYGWQRALCQEATQFVAARCFDKIEGVPDFKAVNPRFSLIYDVGGDGRTALKLSANRYITPLGSSVLGRINPIALASDTREWTACTAGKTSACDLNGDRLPQTNELGPSRGYNFGQFNRYADGYDWPFAVEYSAEIQHQLPGNLVAMVGYTRREKRGNFGSRNVLVPTDTYTQLTVTEANSGQKVTVYNQAAALSGRQDFVWDNSPELDSVYNGADVTLNKRLSHRWMMTGGVSIGKNIGYIGNADLNNPNSQEFSRGILGNDVPYSLRLSGMYELPYGVSASATFQHQEGFPELTTVSVGNNTIALIQGTTAITVEPRAAARLPKLNQLDMSLRRAFRFGDKVFQPRLDLYNLANSSTITARVQTLGSNYHAVNDVQRGRMIKLGMSYDF